MIASGLLLAWLLMQGVHELGHVVAAWLTGGGIERVVLHPLAISRTDVEPNPQPLIVAWGGPLLGVLLPLAIWGLMIVFQPSNAWVARYFAGFCLLANGLYLGVGSFGAVGDAGDIQRHGSPIWTLWVFALLTAPTGLALWNGLGRKFGIGPQAEPLDCRWAYGCAVALVFVALVEAMLAR